MSGARVPLIVYVRVSRTPVGSLDEASCVWLVLTRTRAPAPGGLELERHGVEHASLTMLPNHPALVPNPSGWY